MVVGVNFKEMMNVSAANAVQERLLLTLSSMDGDGITVGPGYQHKCPPKVTQCLLDLAAKERHKEGLHTKLILALQKRNAQLRAEIAQLKAQAKDIEDKFGGLDNMGKEAGLERKTNESDEQYKKRLKEDLQRQLKNGTLEPDSDLALWAQIMQGTDDREAELDANTQALGKMALSEKEYEEVISELVDLEERIEKAENELEAPVLLEELKVAQAAMDVENEKLLTVVETLENSTADQVVHAWESDNLLIANIAREELDLSSANREEKKENVLFDGGNQDIKSESKLSFLDQFASAASGEEAIPIQHPHPLEIVDTPSKTEQFTA